MRGYIEVNEDSYEDVIEHLKRIKLITCKLIEKLSEKSEIYGDDDDEEDKEHSKKKEGRYSY